MTVDITAATRAYSHVDIRCVADSLPEQSGREKYEAGVIVNHMLVVLVCVCKCLYGNITVH